MHAALGLAVACALGACAVPSTEGDARVRADLQELARRSVFFGHQSVGVNVMDGLRQLAAQHAVPLKTLEVRPPTGVPPATFGHSFIPENEDPRLKLRNFREAFESGAAAGAEIALLKFCYVDFKADTDAAALFGEYQATIERLRARYPTTTFVHVTVPLTTVPGGPKAVLKKLLGRPAPPQLVENARRDEYNRLLRSAYQGREPLFDLARVEAIRHDGSLEARGWQGRTIPALVASYSSDGGHLNQEGQRRVARELASVLAAIPRVGPSSPERRD
jgi:hypothetical protein